MQAYRIAKNPSQYDEKHVTVRRKIRYFWLAFLVFLQVHLPLDGSGEQTPGHPRCPRCANGGCASGDDNVITGRAAPERLLLLSIQVAMERTIAPTFRRCVEDVG